jgi:hypothetical protein
MALLTKPSDFTATTLGVTALNDAINRLYTELGYTLASGGDDQGDLTDVNIAVAAAIQRTKIADTAVVCGNTIGAGTQTVTRPTVFAGGLTATGGFSSGALEAIDTTSTNRTAVTPIADGVNTLAIVDANKRFQNYSYANTSASDATILTYTGGTVGRVYTIIVDNADATQVVNFAHNTGNVANSFKLRATSTSGAALGPRMMGTFVFGDLNASGVNQMWEI